MTFTSLAATMEPIEETISLSLTSKQISGPKYCLLIVHPLQLETDTLLCSINDLFTYLVAMTDLLELMTSTNTALIRASGPCKAYRIPRLDQAQGTHTVP